MIDARCQSVEVRRIGNIIALMRLGFFFLLITAILSIFIEKGSILCFTYYLLAVTIHAFGWILGFANSFGWFVDCSFWIPIFEQTPPI
jgi:hypothetical protein